MESIYAIGAGLGLRLIIDVLSRHNSRLAGTLVGLWEGIVLYHFVKKMPLSFDPYVAYGTRLFVDLVVTESFDRQGIVMLWTALGLVLADVSILKILPRPRSRTHPKRARPRKSGRTVVVLPAAVPTRQPFARTTSSGQRVTINSDPVIIPKQTAIPYPDSEHDTSLSKQPSTPTPPLPTRTSKESLRPKNQTPPPPFEESETEPSLVIRNEKDALHRLQLSHDSRQGERTPSPDLYADPGREVGQVVPWVIPPSTRVSSEDDGIEDDFVSVYTPAATTNVGSTIAPSTAPLEVAAKAKSRDATIDENTSAESEALPPTSPDSETRHDMNKLDLISSLGRDATSHQLRTPYSTASTNKDLPPLPIPPPEEARPSSSAPPLHRWEPFSTAGDRESITDGERTPTLPTRDLYEEGRIEMPIPLQYPPTPHSPPQFRSVAYVDRPVIVDSGHGRALEGSTSDVLEWEERGEQGEGEGEGDATLPRLSAFGDLGDTSLGKRAPRGRGREYGLSPLRAGHTPPFAVLPLSPPSPLSSSLPPPVRRVDYRDGAPPRSGSEFTYPYLDADRAGGDVHAGEGEGEEEMTRQYHASFQHPPSTYLDSSRSRRDDDDDAPGHAHPSVHHAREPGTSALRSSLALTEQTHTSEPESVLSVVERDGLLARAAALREAARAEEEELGRLRARVRSAVGFEDRLVAARAVGDAEKRLGRLNKRAARRIIRANNMSEVDFSARRVALDVRSLELGEAWGLIENYLFDMLTEQVPDGGPSELRVIAGPALKLGLKRKFSSEKVPYVEDRVNPTVLTVTLPARDRE